MKKILTSQRGFTLIEVLLTLVITAIVSGVIYSVFTTGLKLYQKIGIEGQLRDDADYVATMILNQMYSTPPHYVQQYENTSSGAKGIEMVRFKPKNVQGYIVEDSNEVETTIKIYLENNKFFIKTNRFDQQEKIVELETESSKNTTILKDGNVEASSISFVCSKENSVGKCEHGRISLNLVVEDINQNSNSFIKTNPLILKSTFGF